MGLLQDRRDIQEKIAKACKKLDKTQEALDEVVEKMGVAVTDYLNPKGIRAKEESIEAKEESAEAGTKHTEQKHTEKLSLAQLGENGKGCDPTYALAIAIVLEIPNDERKDFLQAAIRHYNSSVNLPLSGKRLALDAQPSVTEQKMQEIYKSIAPPQNATAAPTSSAASDVSSVPPQNATTAEPPSSHASGASSRGASSRKGSPRAKRSTKASIDSACLLEIIERMYASADIFRNILKDSSKIGTLEHEAAWVLRALDEVRTRPTDEEKLKKEQSDVCEVVAGNKVRTENRVDEGLKTIQEIDDKYRTEFALPHMRSGYHRGPYKRSPQTDSKKKSLGL